MELTCKGETPSMCRLGDGEQWKSLWLIPFVRLTGVLLVAVTEIHSS
jgi:hypothetical protein